MTNERIRTLIINLLDDEQGINDRGYTDLSTLAAETGNTDVIVLADCENNRWFLGEDDAEDLREFGPSPLTNG